MHFDSFSDFLNMGGYGFYVWLSFSVTFASLLAVYVEQHWRTGKLRAQVIVEYERAQRMKKARQNKAEQARQNQP